MDDAIVANQLDQGTASAFLADICEIREKEKVKVPRDLNQVSFTVRCYAILVHTLFQGPGNSNPFVKCMWLLAINFHEQLPHFLGQHQGLAGTPWADVYAAHVLRRIQITAIEYLQSLAVGGAGGGSGKVTELPAFQELRRDLQRRSFYMSSLLWLPLPASLTDVNAPPASEHRPLHQSCRACHRPQVGVAQAEEPVVQRLHTREPTLQTPHATLSCGRGYATSGKHTPRLRTMLGTSFAFPGGGEEDAT